MRLFTFDQKNGAQVTVRSDLIAAVVVGDSQQQSEVFISSPSWGFRVDRPEALRVLDELKRFASAMRVPEAVLGPFDPLAHAKAAGGVLIDDEVADRIFAAERRKFEAEQASKKYQKDADATFLKGDPDA